MAKWYREVSVHPFLVYHLVAALIEIRQTCVSFNQYSANRQSYNFSNPNSFIPERFLDEGKDERDDMSVFQPFQVRETHLSRLKGSLLGNASCYGEAFVEFRFAVGR